MNKPELDEAIKLFKEFHTKQVDSVPSIKEDWEINGEINIPSEPNKLQKKSMNSEPEETVELNTLSPQSQPNGTTKKVIHIQNDSKSHEKKNKIEYNPFAIPPNWELARKHANARRAKRELGDDEAPAEIKDEICPCCSYEVNRKAIRLLESSSNLNFLGAGYPLIFNYYLYCIIILIILFLSFGVYGIYSNKNGHFCVTQAPTSSNTSTSTNNISSQGLRRLLSFNNGTTNETGTDSNEDVCILDWVTVISIANKLDNPDDEQIQNYFAIIAEILIIIILMYFRKHQRQINNLVDEQTNTPADYTIMVSGIPIGLKCDYEIELRKLFETDPKTQKKYSVEKINLVHNTMEIEEFEKKLKKVVERKKKLLIKKSFNFEDQDIVKIDGEFEEIEHELNKLRMNMITSNEKFAGIAFISFSTEDEKQEIIEKQQVSSLERMKIYISTQKSEKNENDERLYFQNSLLFIEEAPEPNDVNWEFIYSSTKDKIKIRIIVNILFFILLASCFGIIWVITYFQSKSLDQAYENEKLGIPGAVDEFDKAKSITILISAIIVVFNKFCLGRMVHILSDCEKYSNFTKLNISFGTKLSLALFFNTALITLFVEMITFNNYYGYGGMIETEHTIFILNAFLPPFVWMVDPWTILKYFEKKFLMRQVKKTDNKVPITQMEANEIMEDVQYNMAKRYAEIMKTMWFTFFYAPALPIGIVWSTVGIFLYYWVDKYNLIKRRTIKENISMNLTINMIELLEYSLIFFGFSCVLLEKQLYNTFSIQSFVVLIIGVLHSIVPMEEINEKLFPLKSQNETANYQESVLDFDTDYDRENPVTKNESIQIWAKMRSRRSFVKSQASMHAKGILNSE